MTPQYEQRRILELRKYNILDTLTERDYEDVTFMASIICDVPIALISFIDEERQWFKSHLGIDASETLREYSFCSHAINNNGEMLVVEDSRLDERFKDNPLVTGEPNIVFYAGVPLINEEGYGLGTVCIIDNKTRTLTNTQVKALKVLARQVMHLLELRKINYELDILRLQLETRNKDLEQFAMVVSHDIKSPLTSVLLVNEALREDFTTTNNEEATSLINISNDAANKIKTLVDGILSYYQDKKGGTVYEQIQVNEFFESLNKTITCPKVCNINFETTVPVIFFSKVQLEQIFFNLINNSMRYNDKQSIDIKIKLEEEESHYRFSFLDNGIGIAPENHTKIFELFTTLHSTDHFGQKGSGIGLSTIQKIIQDAGGTITVLSEPEKFTEFVFTIKKSE